jgi:flagellar biosynthesis activator protein FlaF
MYNTAFARNAYGETDRTQSAPRRTEYRVFAQVTHRLARAAEGGPRAFPRLAEALHENLGLWNVLAIDLADPRNALPQGLRAELLSLAVFTVRHTACVLERKGDPHVLIDINSAIMRGLRGEGVASAARAAPRPGAGAPQCPA